MSSRERGYGMILLVCFYYMLMIVSSPSSFVVDSFVLKSNSNNNKRSSNSYDRGGAFYDYNHVVASSKPVMVQYVSVSESTHQNDIEKMAQGQKGAISMNLEELTKSMGGWGRARLVWDLYRIGIDPMIYSTDNTQQVDQMKQYSTIQNDNDDSNIGLSSSSSSSSSSSLQVMLKEEKNVIQGLLPTSRSTQGLGKEALETLKSLYPSYAHGRIEGGIADLTHISSSLDGTTKLLIRLNKDGLQVETVIIPWHDKGWSTLCIS